MSTFEVSTAALLRAIVDSATDYAIVTTDLIGTITSWNTGARNVLGWEAEEVLGRAISLIFTAEDVAAGVAAAERAEAELAGRAFDERWHVRKSGARFWATGELMPLRDGEITGFVKILRDRTTERAAQEDILRSERFKAAVLEGALDCIVTIDIKSRVIEWNTAAEQTFGYARESAIGRDLADLIIPAEFHEAHRAGVARYLTTGTGPLLGRRVEIEGVRADQSRFPIELAVAPIKIDDKQFFTARLRDISDRKSAERALADSEERYRLATEAFQGGVAVHDIRAGTVFRTARQLEIIGETARTFPAISTAWEARIHPEDRPAFLGARRGMLSGDSALFEAEYRICHRDGHWVWIWHRGTAMRDGAGAVTRIISSHIDITERKLAEEALRESQQRLQATYEHASVGIVETDADGRLLRVNQAICTISGYTREELLGDTPFDLTHPDDLAEDLRSYAGQVAGNLPAYAVEKRVLRKDGRPVWTAVSSSAVRSRAGQFLYAVRVTEDIDERRRAEERRALLVNELNHRVKNSLAPFNLSQPRRSGTPLVSLMRVATWRLA